MRQQRVYLVGCCSCNEFAVASILQCSTSLALEFRLYELLLWTLLFGKSSKHTAFPARMSPGRDTCSTHGTSSQAKLYWPARPRRVSLVPSQKAWSRIESSMAFWVTEPDQSCWNKLTSPLEVPSTSAGRMKPDEVKWYWHWPESYWSARPNERTQKVGVETAAAVIWPIKGALRTVQNATNVGGATILPTLVDQHVGCHQHHAGRHQRVKQDRPPMWIQVRPVEFEVLDNVSNMLGLNTCEELNLVKRVETLSNDVFSKYADTFTGLGCITGVTHHIQIDPSRTPRLKFNAWNVSEWLKGSMRQQIESTRWSQSWSPSHMHWPMRPQQGNQQGNQMWILPHEDRRGNSITHARCQTIFSSWRQLWILAGEARPASAPLRNLLENGTEWHCMGNPQEKSLQHVKSMVTQRSPPQYLSMRATVAVLLQEQHPIAYASKLLTSSQKILNWKGNAHHRLWLQHIPRLCVRIAQYCSWDRSQAVRVHSSEVIAPGTSPATMSVPSLLSTNLERNSS